MGLYDDDNAAITSGDQNNKEYWWSKYHSIVLEEALKTRQPEGAIRALLKDYALKVHDKALEKYPAHADIKAWKEKAEKLLGKVDPKSTGAFQPNFAWFGGPGGGGGGNFAHWWVNYHWARSARDAGDWATCYESAKHCSMRISEMTADRFKAKYPAEIQAFLTTSAEEINTIFAEAKKRR